jgi:hypothetical protein
VHMCYVAAPMCVADPPLTHHRHDQQYYQGPFFLMLAINCC